MVTFALLDRWRPVPGTLTAWQATPASIAAARRAPVSDVPPTHIQQAYLEDGERTRQRYRAEGLDARFSRLCVITFDVAGPLDRTAMTAAVTAFVRRHDTFLSWFGTDGDGIVRHVVDPADVDLRPSPPRSVTDPDELRCFVQQSVPGPDVWECFGFGTVEHDEGFTVYAAVDHLLTDGISQALTIFDLRLLYETARDGGAPQAQFESGSYLDHCARERAASALLTVDSPSVRRWIEVVRDNGGDLPRFPLDLGRSADTLARTASQQFPLLDPAGADAFDAACAAAGAKFSGGLFAAAAIVQYELTGRSHYVGMAPKSTRGTPAEWASVGWFSSLTPVAFEVGGAATFREVAARAQQAFDAGKSLGDTSFHRVLELAGPAQGVLTRPGWSVPMISYVDVRRLPGADLLAAANVGLFGNRGTSEEVYLWVNRFADHTSATFLHPDTPAGHASLGRWFDRLADVFHTVAATGDRPVVADRLTAAVG